jgi:glucose/arabinose dehydrogenase/mono/diheme cytochrome c family protein
MRYDYAAFAVGLAALCLTLPVSAQDDDEDVRPGLISTLTDGPRREQSLAVDVFVPSQTEQPESHRQSWRGLLLLKSEGRFRFHAFVHGTVQIQLGGRPVLAATTDRPSWVSSEEQELSFGELPLAVSYSQQAGRGRGLKLYWSSDSFPLEPLPYHLLFHEDDSRPLRLAHAGSLQLEAANCFGCHQQPGGEPSTLPRYSLQHIGSGRSWSAMRDRLTRRDADPNHGRMPAFGLSDDDASAVLAYLAKHAEPLTLAEPPKVKINAKETPTGRELIKSVGCLACHEWQQHGQLSPLGGGRLDDVATRRTAAWLDQWLRDPAAINPTHRMPVFKLTDAERQQIITALVGERKFPKENEPPKITDQLVARGREVIVAARCAVCHDLPGDVPAEPAAIAGKPIHAEQVAGREGCLSGQPDPKTFRPVFHGLDQDGLALAMVPQFGRPRLSDLERNGCVNCHDRDGSRGLSNITLSLLESEPQWQGQTPTLTPPPLTAVGDRLQDASLAKAVRGELPVRMNWLKVRMPKFREPLVANIPAELIDHDRIPDGSPATPQYPIAEDRASPDVLLAGRELTGGKGFSCVACHQLKDYVPPKVALGTRGSDLYRLGERMRAPYFFRWTRAPLRILPGVEMPSYQRPHPTLLGGELDKQLAAIWDALHDPQFTAPTNPAVVEQLWGPSDDGRARILRDVVTIPDGNGGVTSVPRSFAVGFANRHSVLFDLERGAVRMWTIGDFARQRTQGKSWFWDMAGVPVAADGPPVSDIFLHDKRTNKIIAETTGWLSHAKLNTYCSLGDGSVMFMYGIHWMRNDGDEQYLAQVWEQWIPVDDKGWRRSIHTESAPDGWDVWLRRPNPKRLFGEPQIAPILNPNWSQPSPESPEGLQIGGREGQRCEVNYQTAVTPPVVASNVVVPESPPPQSVTCLPGYEGVRLPLPRSIMPTAMAWSDEGKLYVTSLKGHVYAVERSMGGELEDQLVLFAEGLAAPFGITFVGDTAIVAHKPEILIFPKPFRRQAGFVNVLASGWGYTDDYHDWTTGIVRDSQGWYYIGLGSDYAHKNRPATESKHRGNILRFNLDGKLESVATELRYPVGLAMTRDDRLFVTDQQGVQNCFNEINFIRPDRRYGVPAKLDVRTDEPAEPAAVQIPHPWTRSVNGLCVWPEDSGHPFAGHLVGAEFNTRFLIRATVQHIDGVAQGAVYPLSKPGETNGPEELVGPICVAFSPDGDLYVGSLHDSGWLGGLNTGDIVRFRASGELPNGLREVRATRDGFAIKFLHPVDAAAATKPAAYTISGYTRVWQGEYATPDSGRHTVTVKSATLSDDGRTVSLSLDGLRTGHVYDIAVGNVAAEKLWPNTAAFTLHKVPQ